MDIQSIFRDLTVIELSGVLAGPAVGMFFAELGARVIKIENKKTNGDITRGWKMDKEDSTAGKSAYYHSVNWNKQSLFRDLGNDTDRRDVIDLISSSDIVICNFKPGSAKKIGMDYSSLREINNELIYANITAYDSRSTKPGFDVTIQAETGWMSMNGEPEGPPLKLPVAVMDILAAHQLKEGILIALLHKMKTGEGSEVTVSLYDTAIASLANQASSWLNLGEIPQRMGSRHPNIAPYGDIFYTKDKKPVMPSIGTDVQFRNLCACLDVPEVASDTRFSTNSQRVKHRKQLIDEFDNFFSNFFSNELLERCARNEVPVSPIYNLKEVFERPESQQLILEQNEADGRISKRVKTAVFSIQHKK